MTWLRVFGSRVRAIFAAPQLDRELEEELRSHIEMETEANVRRGMTPAEARRAALVEFGGIAQTAELYREGRAFAFLETLAQDVRYAFRGFRRSRGFTAVAILSLALGISVNTTLFSVINMLMLRPLPVRDPSSMVTLSSSQKGRDFVMPVFSYPEYRDIREQTAGQFSGILGYFPGIDGLSADGRADRVMTHYVTGNYFTLLGVTPALGRVILPSEGQTEGADPVLVLSYSYWKERFAGDPNVIGKRVLINGHPVTVVGVAAKRFRGVQAMVNVQAFLPVSMGAISVAFSSLDDNRSLRTLYLLGRLTPGVTLAQAEATLKTVSQRLAAANPKDSAGVTIRARTELLGRIPNGDLVGVSAFFLAMAALVLLLACVNLANLLMVRAASRQKEIAMRAALGGSRSRLIRQFLTESFLLTLFGALTGLLLSAWACSALSAVRWQGIPIYLDFSFDGRVIAYTFVAAVLTGLVLGILPAVRGSRANLAAVARDGGQRNSGGPQRTRSILVMAQVAAAFLLLIVASLLTHSLQNAHRLDLGFEARNVANFTLDPHNVGYNEAQGRQFYKDLLRRVRALPEVESAGLAISGPMNLVPLPMQVEADGYAPPKGQPAPTVFYDVVSQDFFQTLRIPIVRGRGFSSDDQNSPRVAIVNQTMAELYWPGKDPLGRKAQSSVDPGHSFEIVGVLKDVRYLAVTELHRPYIFLPYEQNYVPIQTLRVRYHGPAETALAEVRKEIASLAPELPVASMETMLQQMDSSAAFLGWRMEAGFAAALGLLGLALALLGLYGVVSYAAVQRTHEIGVRLTLGASAGDIRKLVLGRGLLIVGIGLPAGLLLSLAAAPILGGLVLGVSANDPLTLAGVAILLACVTFAACYIPARRAMHADPIAALKNE